MMSNDPTREMPADDGERRPSGAAGEPEQADESQTGVTPDEPTRVDGVAQAEQPATFAQEAQAFDAAHGQPNDNQYGQPYGQPYGSPQGGDARGVPANDAAAAPMAVPSAPRPKSKRSIGLVPAGIAGAALLLIGGVSGTAIGYGVSAASAETVGVSGPGSSSQHGPGGGTFPGSGGGSDSDDDSGTDDGSGTMPGGGQAPGQAPGGQAPGGQAPGQAPDDDTSDDTSDDTDDTGTSDDTDTSDSGTDDSAAGAQGTATSGGAGARV